MTMDSIWAAPLSLSALCLLSRRLSLLILRESCCRIWPVGVMSWPWAFWYFFLMFQVSTMHKAAKKGNTLDLCNFWLLLPYAASQLYSNHGHHRIGGISIRSSSGLQSPQWRKGVHPWTSRKKMAGNPETMVCFLQFLGGSCRRSNHPINFFGPLVTSPCWCHAPVTEKGNPGDVELKMGCKTLNIWHFNK